MSKNKRTRKQTQSEEFDLKPDFAMDGFVEKKQTKKEPEKKDAELNVKDRIGASSLSKLEQLRSEMKEEAERVERATATAKGSGKATKGSAEGAQRIAKDKRAASTASSGSASADNLSFAELFNPEPDDEDDFDTMLSDSKLDWRQYK